MKFYKINWFVNLKPIEKLLFLFGIISISVMLVSYFYNQIPVI